MSTSVDSVTTEASTKGVELSNTQDRKTQSPQPQKASHLDLTGESSPSPQIGYSSRPHSPTSLVRRAELKEMRHLLRQAHLFGTIGGKEQHCHTFDTISVHQERERSPLPPIMSREAKAASKNGSLESLAASYGLHSRRPLSPRLLQGSGRQISTTSSFDSEQLRSFTRREKHSRSHHQRSNSGEEMPFNRWGLHTSPPHSDGLQQKTYVPTSLSSQKEARRGSHSRMRADNNRSPAADTKSSPSQLSATRVALSLYEGTLDKSKMMNGSGEGRATTAESLVYQRAPSSSSKRKHQDDDGNGDCTTARSDDSIHSHHSSLAPPSSHLYGDMDVARQEAVGSATSVELPCSSSAKQETGGSNGGKSSFARQQETSVAVQEQDELNEDDDVEEAPNGRVNTSDCAVDGRAVTLVPQRKSCDRCFKMKTKCSRAAPGASGDAPCEGCIRRGYANDCITSRPDFPYPRISLPKRQRRESPMPTVWKLAGTEGSTVFVPPSMMQRGNDWRTKLIVNGMQRGEEARIQQEQSRQRNHNAHQRREQGAVSISAHLPTAARHQGSPSMAARRPGLELYSGHETKSTSQHSRLRDLPTSQLRDLSVSIAEEVSHRSQPPEVKTPVVPSVSSHHHLGTMSTASELSHVQRNVTGTQIQRPGQPSQGPTVLGQQATQNGSMQSLPKAIGVLALELFDLLFFPGFAISALSSKNLEERFERYVKPGRNNLIELAMAIGLQLQGLLLSCPDKSQASTIEGRIFKAFLESSKHSNRMEQKQQFSRDPHRLRSQDNKEGSGNSMSIDSVKSWIEPTMHRSRAKDMVKHVMMRRCLKCGLDYDDVVENVLLAHFHLLGGAVGFFHIFAGNAQRQIEMLKFQQSPRDALWTEDERHAIQAKVAAMERLHPLSFFSTVSAPSAAVSTTSQSLAGVVSDVFLSLEAALSQIAAFVQSRQAEDDSLSATVDDQLELLRQSLPMHMQTFICSDWLNCRLDAADSDWISDLIRAGAPLTPFMRLTVCLQICYLKLFARSNCLIKILCKSIEQKAADGNTEASASGTTCNGEEISLIRQVKRIASSMLSSTLMAFTVCPQLVCLAQSVAAELTASAWNYVVSQLLIMQSGALSTEEKDHSLSKVQACLTQLIVIFDAVTEEREAWPFGPSLRMAEGILKDMRERDMGAKEWLVIMRLFTAAHPDALARILRGDPWAVDELRKEYASGVSSSSSPPPAQQQQ